jgi:superoxide dismutase, Fe-Mn family
MELKKLPFTKSLDGISDQTIAIHHDKLYAGYVKKTDEIREALSPLEKGGDVSSANQSYSQLRSLKTDETFALNGVYLHEYYFDVLGGDGIPSGALSDALATRFGSVENFIAYMTGCGMAARGWVVLAWDVQSQSLQVYTGDAHNHGGVWGCLPIIVLDVYEHAYFIDKGSDRKAYIEQFWKNLNWATANALFQKAMNISA